MVSGIFFFFTQSAKANEIHFDSIQETPTYTRDISGEPDETSFGFVWLPTATSTFNYITLGLTSLNATPAYDQYIEVYELTSLNQYPADNLRIATSTNFFEVGTAGYQIAKFYFPQNITASPNKYYSFRSNYTAGASYSPSQPIQYDTLSTPTVPICTNGNTPCRRTYTKAGSVVGTSDETMWGRIGFDSTVYKSRITAVTSPLTQAQTNNVTYSVNIYNGEPQAYKFCVQAHNNFQSLQLECKNLVASGNTSSSQTLYYPNDGNYTAVLSIQTSDGTTLDSKSVSFYVNSRSQSYLTPTSTDTGITDDFLDRFASWTCAISYLSNYDPCQTIAQTILFWTIGVWNQVITFFTGFLAKPPFVYISQSYTLFQDSISNTITTTSTLPSLTVDWTGNQSVATSTIQVFSQSTLTGAIPQSLWDKLRTPINYLLYVLFFIWLYHYALNIPNKLHK